jgi:hypothetical protein
MCTAALWGPAGERYVKLYILMSGLGLCCTLPACSFVLCWCTSDPVVLCLCSTCAVIGSTGWGGCPWGNQPCHCLSRPEVFTANKAYGPGVCALVCVSHLRTVDAVSSQLQHLVCSGCAADCLPSCRGRVAWLLSVWGRSSCT